MKPYSCIIIDDETLAQDLIEAHLKKIPNIDIVAKCHTAMEALTLLNQRKIDLMFLDIEMPGLSGVEFLKALERPPYTILTTAYSEYALMGYELNIVDYLLKPISFDRFFKALSKALALLQEKEPSPVDSTAHVPKGDFIFVKSDYKAVKISFSEMLYIESMQKYVKFHLMGNKRVVSLMGISALANVLPADRFFRCHRSFIVSLDTIESISGNQLVLVSGDKVPIGKDVKSTLLKLVDRNGLL